MAHEANLPYIPSIQGEIIKSFSFDVFGINIGISNTILSTWIFIVFLFIILIFFKKGLNQKGGFFKTTGLLLVKGLNDFTFNLIGNKKFAKKILFLVGGMFIFILLSNVFSLILDWIMTFALLHKYFRPINSDLNTTLGLALIIIILSNIISIFHRGIPKYLKGYIFNFTGEKFFEKCINVFVGWLHFIGEIVKIFSLSIRLFGNIFAGIVLIGMMVFLTGQFSILGVKFGELLVLPFWLFELFVAFIQAIVFYILSSIYFKQAIEDGH